MKYICSFFVICLLVMSTQVFCMQLGGVLLNQDTTKHVVAFLDFRSTVAFFKTCTGSYNVYKQGDNKENPIDFFLLSNKKRSKSFSRAEYVTAFVHYSQQSNKTMLELLMSNENRHNKEDRHHMFCIFGYETNEELQNIECAMRVYRGMYKNNDVVTGYRSLCSAAMLSHVEILLKNGVDINAVDEDGKTALHHAILRNNASIRCFLKKGINVNAVDKYGKTALDYGLENNVPFHVIGILFAYGANVTTTFKLKAPSISDYNLCWLFMQKKIYFV